MQSFTAAQCPVMNVCFLYYSKLKLTKVSPESLPSAVQNLATLSSYISHMTRCFLYLRLLHRGQGSPQPSAPMNWQKKKKATQLTISLKARGEMKEGIPAIKCCSCSTDILQNGSRSSQVLTSSEYLYPSSQSRSGGKKKN